jgi:hypothetical protein
MPDAAGERPTMMALAQGPIYSIDAALAIHQHGYHGSLTVRQGTLAQVQHFCHTMHGIVSPYRALGCSKVDAHSCFVMIPKIAISPARRPALADSNTMTSLRVGLRVRLANASRSLTSLFR